MQGTIAQLQVPLLGFTDITNILQRCQSARTLPEMAGEQNPTPVVGPTLFVSCMLQDAWGNLPVNMVTCQLSIMGVASAPMVTVTEMPNLKDAPISG